MLRLSNAFRLITKKFKFLSSSSKLQFKMHPVFLIVYYKSQRKFQKFLTSMYVTINQILTIETPKPLLTLQTTP